MGARTWSWTEEWHLEDDGTPYARWRRVLPRIEDVLLDSVVYMYPSRGDANAGEKSGGSGFLVGAFSPIQNVTHVFVVTNEHVVKGDPANNMPKNLWARLTTRQNDKEIEFCPFDDWAFPLETDEPHDLAIWHYKTIIASHDSSLAFVNRDRFMEKGDFGAEPNYGPGDECFMLGRFIVNDGGRERNLPTARFGNISRLPGPVERRAGISVDAFLVETRSQAGYSGSPVFSYRPDVAVTSSPVPAGQMAGSGVGYSFGMAHITISPKLLGVDFAHLPNRVRISKLDERNNTVTRQHPDIPRDARVEVGSGMLIVVPAWELATLIDREVSEMEQERASGEVVEDSADDGGTSLDKTQSLLHGLTRPGVKEEAEEIHRNH